MIKCCSGFVLLWFESITLASSFWSCFFPPFRARFSASSSRCCRSFTVTSMFFFILSRWALVSCSFFSSSAIMAAWNMESNGEQFSAFWQVEIHRKPIKSSYVSDGLLGFLLSVPGSLDAIIHLALNLRQIRLQLLATVEEAGVL